MTMRMKTYRYECIYVIEQNADDAISKMQLIYFFFLEGGGGGGACLL